MSEVTLVKDAIVWFVPDVNRPWRVQVGDTTYVCRALTVHQGRTVFLDAGHHDLPGSPRGVLHAIKATLVDAEVFQTRAAT